MEEDSGENDGEREREKRDGARRVLCSARRERKQRHYQLTYTKSRRPDPKAIERKRERGFYFRVVEEEEEEVEERGGERESWRERECYEFYLFSLRLVGE